MADGAGYRHSTVVTEDLSRYLSEMGPGQNIDFLRRLKWGVMGSTIHLVSNCESVTDWDIENASYFNAVDETTDKVCGSNALELVDAGTTTGTCLTLDEGHRPVDEDWSEFNWLCMWVHDDTALRLAGELTVQIRNNGVWGTELSVPVNSNADVFEYKCIDISGEDRNCVDGFRFVNQRGTGSSEKVYIDEIIVTDLITGLGTGLSVATGPVIGPVRAMNIATGQTIVPGDAVTYAAGGVSTASSGAHNVIGVACQHTSTTSTVASDTVPKEILVACPGSIVIMRNDSSGLAVNEPGLIGSDVVTEAPGTATANAEDAFCIALETGTANFDSTFILCPFGTED